MKTTGKIQKEDIECRARHAIRIGKRINNNGVVQAGENILIGFANDISVREIMGTSDYDICLRVWYR